MHSYEHDPKSASYGLEAAEKLGLEPAQVFKTLLACTEKNELLVAVVPVAGTLDLKALAQAAGAKKVEMADPMAAQPSHQLSGGRHQPAGAEEAPAHLYRQLRTGAAEHLRQRRPSRAGSGAGTGSAGRAHKRSVRPHRSQLTAHQA